MVLVQVEVREAIIRVLHFVLIDLHGDILLRIVFTVERLTTVLESVPTEG